MCVNLGHILHDSYEILALLGQGGFARTYTAAQLNKPHNPLCVVKEIPFPSSNDPRVLERGRKRFDREASALCRLGRNSRIPELFDRFEANDHCYYLVQEYVEGHPLSQELTAGYRWNEQQTVAF
ncbi:MAG: serine/threonine protein kinase, partial [Microcoleus sp. T3-bin5]|nr:serine/threonine protein kinase [Microcoleus sp. T3-bin5]